MVHLVHTESKLSAFESAFAGGLSGAVTRTIAQPLDVLKIRFQLQIEPIKHGSKYSSMVQAVYGIITEEGITTLWSGHVPAQLLSVTYGIIQFSSFEKLTQISQQVDSELYKIHKHAINFSNGAVAATVATIFSFPFDTIRTRLIAEQKTCKAYKGFIDASSIMIKKEGYKSLFKGLVPTLGQIAPHAGIQFAVYKMFTENIFSKFDFFQRTSLVKGVESSLVANMLAGSIAGLIAKTAIYPFDLVKKRLQIQGFQQHRKGFGEQMYCRGLLECIKLTVSAEGFLSLYKGYGPSMLKAVLVSALHFAIYDEIKHAILRSKQ